MKLKIEVVHPNIERMFDMSKLTKQLEAVAKQETGVTRRSFGRFTATWKNPTIFDVTVGMNGQNMEGVVSSSSTPFVFVEGGTSSMPDSYVHNFSPKTTRRVIGSRAGSRGYIIATRRMVSPGIQAREVRYTIVEKRAKPFSNSVINTIKRNLAIAAKRGMTGGGK